MLEQLGENEAEAEKRNIQTWRPGRDEHKNAPQTPPRRQRPTQVIARCRLFTPQKTHHIYRPPRRRYDETDETTSKGHPHHPRDMKKKKGAHSASHAHLAQAGAPIIATCHVLTGRKIHYKEYIPKPPHDERHETSHSSTSGRERAQPAKQKNKARMRLISRRRQRQAPVVSTCHVLTGRKIHYKEYIPKPQHDERHEMPHNWRPTCTLRPAHSGTVTAGGKQRRRARHMRSISPCRGFTAARRHNKECTVKTQHLFRLQAEPPQRVTTRTYARLAPRKRQPLPRTRTCDWLAASALAPAFFVSSPLLDGSDELAGLSSVASESVCSTTTTTQMSAGGRGSAQNTRRCSVTHGAV